MHSLTAPQVHWFSIVNSLLIVLFLTAMIAMILIRNLHRDIMRYNRVPTDEEKAEEREETGWKVCSACLLMVLHRVCGLFSFASALRQCARCRRFAAFFVFGLKPFLAVLSCVRSTYY